MNSVAHVLGIHNPPLTRSAECETHGQYVSKCYMGTRWTSCPSCHADAEARKRDEDEASARESARQAWQRRIGTAGIPERFHDRSLGNFVADTDAQRRALAFATGYADGFDAALATGRCALLIGKPGTGKTHLAVGIGLQIMRRDSRSALFTTVIRAIRRVKDTWRRDSDESESDAIAALVFPDLLILDEVGVQFGSETEKLILFDVLNERYEQRKPALLLSNLALGEVKAYLGERIFDRLREDGGDVVVFDWKSHRGKTVAHHERGNHGL